MTIQTQPQVSPRRRGRLLASLVVALLVVCVALPLIGLLSQAIATANDQRLYPPAGQLIDIGGRRLHLVCSGAGSPTVILEAASDATSASWGWVQPDLAQTVRVCSYDRAGRGWSDPGPAPRDAAAIVRDLHAALAAAGEAPPYVMAGHSTGGLFVRAYAAAYPSEVRGLALIDAANPNEELQNPAYRDSIAKTRRIVGALDLLARFGVLHTAAGSKEPGPTLPQGAREAARSAWASPNLWASVAAEINARAATDDQVRRVGPLGALPVLVLTAEQEAAPMWISLQQDLAGISATSFQTTAPATHFSLLHDPEDARTTADAIRRVIAAAQRADRP